LPKARLGSYAVLGNHEYWAGCADAMRAALARAGVVAVSGRCQTVPDGSLRVCGTEAPWGPDYDRPPASPAIPTVALSHTPDNVYELAERGADVVFAGHTHGGQLRLPLLGALIVPSRYGRRFDRGRFDLERTHLFVSAGVGADAPALRLWCRPELVVVDLQGRAAPG
jgi:predicted MPP superfamily phosphohydrolase